MHPKREDRGGPKQQSRGRNRLILAVDFDGGFTTTSSSDPGAAN